MTEPRVIKPEQFVSNTLIPLWLGAGKTAGNAFLGAPGAALQWIGQMFEPTKEQLERQKELYRASGEFVGLPEHLRMAWYAPPEPNAATRAGRYLLGKNAEVQDNVRQARNDLLNGQQGLYTKTMEGIGAMLIPFLFAGAGGKPAKAFTEAMAETGDLATDMHVSGQTDREAAKIWLMNFLTNLGLNAGLELTPEGSEWLKKAAPNREWTDAQKVIADIVKELIEEGAVQEPMQRIIYDASAKTAQNGSNYIENLANGLQDYPRKLREVITGRE